MTGVRDALVVFDSRGTPPTAVAVGWTGCQSTWNTVWMRNDDIPGKRLCQIVIAVTLLPELRDRFRCVLCLSSFDWTRVFNSHGWVSATRIDTQWRTCANNARKPLRILSQSTIQNRIHWLDEYIPASRGGAILVVENPIRDQGDSRLNVESSK